MTYSKIYPIITSVLVVMALSSNADSQQNNWDLDIELSNNRYVLHEPVWLDITLTNIGADTQRTHGLTAPNHRQFYIELKDSLGKPLEYNGPLYLIAPGPGGLVLAPGQQDFGSFDVVRLFGVVESNSSSWVMTSRFPFIPGGSYTIQTYFDGAVSNESSFTIVEPSGETEDALKLIERASSAFRQDNTVISAEMFAEVVAKYPENPFLETCFYLSRFFSPEVWTGLNQGTYDKRQLKRTMLNRYPNSGNAVDWIRALSYNMDQQTKMDFLNKLIEANPGTRSAKYARVVRERIAKQKAD